MRTLTAAAMTLAVLAGTPAIAAEADGVKPKRECFNVSSINGWEFIKPDIVRLQVGVSKYYDLKMMVKEPELAYREVVGFRTRPGQPFVCGPLDIDIVGGRWIGRVPVVSITRVEKTVPAENSGTTSGATPG
jgi:hypothetical protein